MKNWVNLALDMFKSEIFPDRSIPRSQRRLYHAGTLSVNPRSIFCKSGRAIGVGKLLKRPVSVKFHTVSPETISEQKVHRVLAAKNRPSSKDGYWVQMISDSQKDGYSVSITRLEIPIQKYKGARMHLIIAEALGAIGIIQMTLWQDLKIVNLDWSRDNILVARPPSDLPVRLTDAGLLADNKHTIINMAYWSNEKLHELVQIAAHYWSYDAGVLALLGRLSADAVLPQADDGRGFDEIASMYSEAWYAFSIGIFRAIPSLPKLSIVDVNI